jgi:hypothetical protein
MGKALRFDMISEGFFPQKYRSDIKIQGEQWHNGRVLDFGMGGSGTKSPVTFCFSVSLSKTVYPTCFSQPRNMNQVTITGEVARNGLD